MEMIDTIILTGKSTREVALNALAKAKEHGCFVPDLEAEANMAEVDEWNPLLADILTRIELTGYHIVDNSDAGYYSINA